MKSPCMHNMLEGTRPQTLPRPPFLITFMIVALLPRLAASLSLQEAGGDVNGVRAPVDTTDGTAACEALEGPSGEIVWDYIVVGSGAGGIPFATKVAEESDCATVLLLEYGGPSLYRTGGRWQAPWMEGQELTPFDMWSTTNVAAQNRTHFCDDETTENAACVIGGGTAVNAGQSFTPPSRYWDKYFPEGWKAKDVAEEVQNVRSRSPTSPTPSTDGLDYFTEIFPPMKAVLEAVDFEEVDVTAEFELKERHFGRSQFYTVAGQRGGPVVSYLMDALQMPNFRLQGNTKVLSVLRNGTEVTGVRAEVEGAVEQYMAARVVLAAGAFGTPAILFNSGIGPEAQLTAAAGVAHNGVPQSEWIETPVGMSLHDNPAATLTFRHPDAVQFTVGNTMFADPDPEFLEMYLADRSGPYSFLGRVVVLWMDTDVEGVGGEGDKINFQAICSPSGVESGTFNCAAYVGEGIHSRAQVRRTETTGETCTRQLL